jgi:uncharacterized protein (TIGR02231 family)
MKRYRFCRVTLVLSLIFLFNVGAGTAATEITPTSSIQKIVVYPDRAMITRTANVKVKEGENIVILSGITAALIDESVEVGAKGGRITDVKVEKTFLTKVNQEKVKSLGEKLEAINGRIKAHSNEVAVMQNTVEFLKRVNPFPQNQKIPSPEIEGHVKFVEKSLGESLKQIASIEEKIKKLTDEKKMIEQELSHLQSLKEESKNIVVYLLSNRDSSLDLSCSYVVTGASWQPQYEARADSHTSRVELGAFAVLKQSTDEDWKGVNLEISTAKPSVHGTPPELSAWYVDVYKPRPVILKSLEGVRRREALEEKVLMKEELEKEPPPLPTVQTEATAFSFVLPTKVDIPTDNQPHKVLLASTAKEVRYNYYAVPKLSKSPFLKTDLRNPFSFPLLSGGMNLFVDGRFVSAGSLQKTILADENMDLSLGIDETIKVERKLLKRYTETVGAFSKETKENYEYLLEVANGKAKEITIEVKDSYPSSRNEKIKVDLKSPGKGEANIGDDGIITWSPKLAPGEKRHLKIIFTVTYPKDLKVTGLE